MKMFIALGYHVGRSTIRRLAELGGRSPTGLSVVLTYHHVSPRSRGRFARQLDEILRVGRSVTASQCDDVPAGEHWIAVTFDDGYASFLGEALVELQSRCIPATLFIPSQLLGRDAVWSEGAAKTGEKVMTEAQLRRLQALGFEIGSHTRSHRRLSTLSEVEKIQEIAGSKTDLERILGVKVSGLAFPFNDFDDHSLAIAERAGFKRAYANVPVGPRAGRSDVLRGRVDVTPEDWGLEFWLKIRGAYQWLPLLIGWKRAAKASLARSGMAA